MKITAVAILFTLLLGACADQGNDGGTADAQTGTPVDDPIVTIADMEFKNGSITIEEGTTVTWVWEDAPVEHNVVFDQMESPLQAEGTWSHTFEETGTFDYHCTPHPFMQGTITVLETE